MELEIKYCFPIFNFSVCLLAFNLTLGEEKCVGKEAAVTGIKLCSEITAFLLTVVICFNM
jgi:hypothetical protein